MFYEATDSSPLFHQSLRQTLEWWEIARLRHGTPLIQGSRGPSLLFILEDPFELFFELIRHAEAFVDSEEFLKFLFTGLT